MAQHTRSRVRRRRTRTTAVVVWLASGAAGFTAPPAVAATPDARTAAPSYASLKAVGLTVRSASLKSRTLRVKVTATRRLALRFAVVRGTKQLGSAKISVPRGTTSLKLLLNQKSRGTNLRLRVTARAGRTRGRQRVGVALIPLPLRPAPQQGQGGPAANATPTALTLVGGTVAENQPAGTAVGTLAGTDPDAADVLTYALVGGEGSDDNGSFTLADGTLRTVAPLDAEAKATYRIRARVSDGRGGTFERAFTITVTNVNEAPAVPSISSSSLPENQAAGTVVGVLSAADPDLGDAPAFSLVAGDGDADNGAFAIVGDELRSGGPLDFETRSSYTVRVRVTDAAGATAERAIALAVTDVNEAPTAVLLSNAAVAENRAAGEVVGTLSAPDPDGGDSATFALVPGPGGDDNASFAVVAGTLTTTAALDREVQDAYTVRVRATDTGGLAVDAVLAITVTDVNDAPVVTTSAGTTAITEGAPATPVDGALTVADQDDTELEGAVVRVATGLRGGDELVYADQSGISGTYDSGTGILTLSGTASVADYQAALRSVAFRHAGDDPGTARTVRFTVDDGDAVSAPADRAIAITPVNDAPVLTTTAAALAYPEGAGPVAADPGLTVTDADSAQLAGATVQITADHNAAQDTLAFTNQLGISGSYDAGTATLTLTGTASVASYQAALRTVTYANSSAAPTPATRTLTFLVADTDGATSGAATRDVSLGAVNDAATVTMTPTALAYTEGAAPATLDAGLTVADPDDTDLEGAVVRLSAGFQAGDVLGFVNQGGITGSYNSGTGVLTLTGTASRATYQTALRSVTYEHVGDSPVAVKTAEVRADDGDGLGPAATRTIDVTAVNDAPTVVAGAGELAYTENDPATAIAPGLTVTDPDSAQITGATATITTGFSAAQDELGFTNAGGITGSYDDATGVLTLTGTATVAAYQAALRTVTYVNAGDGPSPASRVVSFTATDAQGATSAPATRGIAIAAVNDPPAAADDTGTTDEDAVLSVAAPGVLTNDTDPDPGDTRTVTRLNGSTTLTATLASGASVTVNADGSYSYDPQTAFQGLSDGESDTDSFTYRVDDAAGATSTATVTITITGVSDAPTAVADSFDAIGNTGLHVGTVRPAGRAGKVTTGSVLANDTDPDSDPGELVVKPVVDAPTTLGGTITIAADGTFTYEPDDGDTGVTDTFAYRVCDTSPCTDATPSSATGTLSLPLSGQVWYVQNTAAAGGDGTSDGPFDTLGEAEAASSNGDTVYVFDGDNTSTGLGGGFAMAPSERLIGEHRGLSLDPDGGGPLGTQALHPATPGAHPTLTATGEDVVVLAASATVDGVTLDPQGAGGGIFGGAGVSGATIADVNVLDTGTAGTQPGVELDGTSGTTSISDLVVSTVGATGVRLNNAGTVTFDPASQVSVTTAGATGLDLAGTALGTSTIDDVTVTGSATGGVALTNLTGTLNLGDGAGTDLALTTTSGTAAAFAAANVPGLTVNASGIDDVAATGGPAVAVTGSPGVTLAFDAVSSTNSAGDGIDLAGLGAGTFSAASGSITGAAGIAFDLDGGSGAVGYPGALGNGAGQTAEITGRSGGAVTLSGAITDTNDAGGGIALSGNTGGSTTLSNAAKTLNTGAQHAVVMSSSDGHTLTFSGGGLDVDTTSGKGVEATTSGTLVVSGAGNTIDTTTGRALNVSATDIGAANLTFQRISANGAPSGILLDTTGSTGRLLVTGVDGTTCTAGNTSGCSGGEIRNTTGADSTSATPDGTGIVLKDTTAPSLTRMYLHDHANYAIRGTNVAGFTLDTSVVSGVNGTSDVTVEDSSLRFEQLTGSASITNTAISGGYEDNVRVRNTSGTLDRLTVSGTTIGLNSTAGGNDGIALLGEGTATLKATITGSTFTGARGDLVQFDHTGSGPGDLVITGSAFSNAHPAIATGGGGVTLGSGGTTGSTTLSLTSNTFRDAVGHAVLAVKTPGAATQAGTFSNNTIGVSGVANSGSREGSALKVQLAEGGGAPGTSTWTVTNNQLRQYNNFGVEVLAGGGAAAGGGTLSTTITGNTIEQPGNLSTLDRWGMHFNIGTVPGDTYVACLVIGGAGALANTLNASGAGTNPFDVRLRQRQSTTVRLPGYAGANNDNTAVQNFLAANNLGTDLMSASNTVGSGGGGFTGASCG